jgi:hypothetical protein
VPILIDVLKKEKATDVKLAVVEALTQFGPNAKPALPVIRQWIGETKDKKLSAQLKAATKSISGK